MFHRWILACLVLCAGIVLTLVNDVAGDSQTEPAASRPAETSTRPTIKEGKVRAFFQDEQGTVAKIGLNFPGYCIAPKAKTDLKVDDYPNLVESFDFWTKRLLAPRCVPSTEFIHDHMILQAATKEQPADAVYLPLRVGDLDCMIVQTGGDAARVYLFVCDNGGKLADDPQPAQAQMLARLKPYLNDWRLPKFKVAKTGELWSLYYIYDQHEPVESYYDRVKVIASKNEIGFVVTKDFINEMTAPWIPLGEEWFAALKRQAKITKSEDE